MRQSNKHSPLSRPNIVGIVDSPRALSVAHKLRRSDLDYLEWRADCLPHLAIPDGLKLPWILTIRHPAEGGHGALDTKTRRRLFHTLLHSATAIDVEARALTPLGDVVSAAQDRGSLVIASSHHFKNTPSTRALLDIDKRSRDLGADIVKIATRTDTPGDVARLLDLLERTRGPLSVMGMGSLGMPSRLLLASCGSVLNYGWLDRPNVPGQWSALELKAITDKLGS